MAADKEVFQTVITAKDESASVLAAVHDRFKHLGQEAEHVGREIERMHRPHVFAEMGEHVEVLKDHFGELHANIGEIGSSITELLPALGALGAVGSLASLFETAEHVSESYAQLAHTATSLGMTTSQLQHLSIVATLTDTSVEGMEKSMSKLNRVIADSAGGHNKQAAATFAQVGISLRDGNGHLRSAIDILPQLADAFQRTGDAATRSQAARGFFGKPGDEMIPLMMQGGKHVKAMLHEGSELGFDFAPYKESLEGYNESMKKLQISTHAFTDEVGAKLTPVLKPVVDMATRWVTANRDWIATGIAGKVGELATWVKAVDWKAVGDEVEHWAKGGERFVDALGGAKGVSEALAGIIVFKGIEFAASPLVGVYKFSKEVVKLGDHILDLVGFWGKVGDAAVSAEGRATAAAAVGGGGAGVGAAVAAGAAAPAAAAVGSRFASLDRLQNTLQRNARGAPLGNVNPALANRIRGLGIGVALQSAYNAYQFWEESKAGMEVDKDLIRNFPGMAAQMTRAQFDALPDHIDRGRSPLASMLGITGDAQHPGWFDRNTAFFDRARDALFGAPLPASAGDSRLPFKVEGGIDTTIKLIGLPAGASVETTSTTRGYVRPPMFITDDTGQAFGDRHGHR